MSEQRSPGAVPTFELRHRLARALEAAGVSNEEMAEEIGRGVTTIRNYLRGRTIPERAVLVTWALRCGVPFDWLAYGVEPDDGGPRTPSDLPGQSSPCMTDNVVPLRGVEWGGRHAVAA